MRAIYDTLYHMTHAKKRIRKLSTAVFRGSRTEYNFDVYPISTSITDHAVVFIFSRRKVDKKGRAHHAVSCVGETQSIISEIKRHKRARCVKGNEANVVCILKEPDRATRSGVLEDISTARAFSCVQGKFKPTIKAKLDVVRNGKGAKILPFKPLSRANARTGVAAAPANNAKSRLKSARQPDIKPTSKPAEKRKRSGTKTVERERASESRKRIPSGVDSDSGQHRLSNPKRTVTRSAKTRVAGGARSRTKLAA